MTRPRPITVAVFLVAVLATGCGGCAVFGESPAGAYVSADKGTFNAVGPEYSGYVNADPKLSADQKDRRQRTLSTWRVRIENAIKEGSTAAPPPAAPPTVQPIP
jgi:hypothetical protein